MRLIALWRGLRQDGDVRRGIAGELLKLRGECRMRVVGLTRQQIAATIKNPATGKPIHQATLTDHFSEEIEAGQARLITEVGTSLWRLALHGENERERRAACEFLLARRGGPAWKEHQQVDVTTHVIKAL